MKSTRIMKASSIYLFSLCLLMFACSADPDNDPDSDPESNPDPIESSSADSIIACHETNNPNLIEISQALYGEWTWAQQFNPWQNIFDTTAYAGGRINFSSDGTYAWSHDSTVSDGKWIMRASGNQFCPYILDMGTDNPDRFFDGCIYMCEDQYIIYASPADGYDMWFHRVD